MAEYPVWPEAELREIAADLTPAMRHALLRCSDHTDWVRGHRVSFARDWCDVVAGFKHATFRGTLRGLEKRGLVEIAEQSRHDISATLLGLAVRGRLIREGCRP